MDDIADDNTLNHLESLLGGELPEEKKDPEDSQPTQEAAKNGDETTVHGRESAEESPRVPEQGQESQAEPLLEEPKDQRFRVKTPQGEMEVPLQELINGYQRQQDYTRKTQELSQERQQTDQQRAQYEQYILSIPTMTNLAEHNINQALGLLRSNEMVKLAAEDPAAYLKEQARLNKFIGDNQDSLVKLNQDYAMHQAQQQQVQQQQYSAMLEEGNRYLAKSIDGWGTPEVDQQLEAYVQANGGFSDTDTPGQVYAKRMTVAWKAMQYDNLMAKQPLEAKKVANLPPKQVLSQGNVAPDDEFVQKRNAALRKSKAGDPNALIDLMAGLL